MLKNMEKISKEGLRKGNKYYFLSRGYVEATNDNWNYLVVRYESDKLKGTYAYLIEFGRTMYGERTYDLIIKKLNHLVEFFDLVQIETDFETYSLRLEQPVISKEKPSIKFSYEITDLRTSQRNLFSNLVKLVKQYDMLSYWKVYRKIQKGEVYQNESFKIEKRTIQ
jgi:hypothetical protein